MTEEIKQEVAADEEEQSKPEEVITYPLKVVYCGISGIPPEYNEWAGKKVDQDECKAWLSKNHPDLFTKLY